MEEYELIETFVIYGITENNNPQNPENPNWQGIPVFDHDITVKIFANKKSPYNITVSMSPTNIAVDLNDKATSRFFAPGSEVTRFCDDTTLVKITAINTFPYAQVDSITTSSTECGYNGGGGSCTLTIREVEINDGDAEIIAEGYFNLNGVEYNIKQSPDAPSTGWSGNNLALALEPGTYWAFVREAVTACFAKKQFEIVESGQTSLKITDINVVNERHEFSDDGSVTIIAESSFGPLQYSLNNSVWQNGNQFSNLAPGNYTVYVKDTKQTKTANFTVLPFSSFINKTPSLEVAEGNVSRWVAIHNPLTFRFLRSDYNIVSILPYPSSTAIEKKPLLVLDQTPAGVVAGGFVVVRSQMYRGSFKVLSVNGANVVLDTRFIESQITSGYLITSAKNNYRIELKVATGIGPEKEISLGYFTSDLVGLVTCQVQSKLKNLVNNKNEFTYDKINWRDLNAAASFEVYYREVWDGNENPQFKKISESFYFTNSAKQFGDPFGSNMGDFVPFPSYPQGKPKARFLTDFKVPTLFAGYPFDLSFIYSDAVLGQSLMRSETLLDVNASVIGVPTNTVMVNQDGSALINQDNTMILIEEGYEGFVPVSKALGIHRLMLSSTSMLGMEYKQVSLGFTSDDEFIEVTEKKRVRINNNCRNNPYYLAWVNTLGGWDYWLFETTQKINLGTGNVKTYDIYIDDIKEAQGVTETLSKDAADKITLGATLDVEDFKAVRGLLYSPKVLLLIGTNPVKWLTVQVEQSSAPYDTKENVADLEFSIILPPINIQSN